MQGSVMVPLGDRGTYVCVSRVTHRQRYEMKLTSMIFQGITV